MSGLQNKLKLWLFCGILVEGGEKFSNLEVHHKMLLGLKILKKKKKAIRPPYN